MPRLHLHAGLTAAAAAIAALVAGCASGGAQVPGGTLEKPDLTVAVVPAVDSAGFFVALRQGLFAAQGLRIRYVPAISSETVIAAQEAGEYDITAGNYVSYIQAAANGRARLQIIAEGSTMQAGDQVVYTAPGSPVTTIAQLKGRRVAINAPMNINYLLVASVLAEHGIPPSAVRFVPVPFPAMGQALKSRQVAAAAIPEPFASEYAQSIGATELFDTGQGATQDFPILGYVVTRAWALRYPATLAAFVRALEQGQRIADTNREAVEAAMRQFTGISGVTASVMALDTYPLGIDRIRLQRVPDVMRQFGLLTQPFAITSMLG